MLLRRITQHVKTQNWTAVALDFVIVVVGVFIGIQVSNWNDARATARQEIVYLHQLREEVAANNLLLRHRVDYTRTVVSSGERVSRFLNGGAPCLQACAPMLLDVFFSSQLWGSDLTEVTSNEMQRQGLPRAVELKKAVKAYYTYSTGLEKTLETAALYRVRVRRILPLEVQRELWRACFSLRDGSTEFLHVDCAPDISNAQAADILNAMQNADDLVSDLNYWIGQNELWINIFTDQIRAGEELMAMITNDIEGGQ